MLEAQRDSDLVAITAENPLFALEVRRSPQAEKEDQGGAAGIAAPAMSPSGRYHRPQLILGDEEEGVDGAESGDEPVPVTGLHDLTSDDDDDDDSGRDDSDGGGGDDDDDSDDEPCRRRELHANMARRLQDYPDDFESRDPSPDPSEVTTESGFDVVTIGRGETGLADAGGAGGSASSSEAGVPLEPLAFLASEHAAALPTAHVTVVPQERTPRRDEDLEIEEISLDSCEFDDGLYSTRFVRKCVVACN